jgi:PAS domain S-box-containing protein
MDEHPLTLLLEYLDDSPQPTFVLCLSDVGAEFTHANPALQRLEQLHINVLSHFRRVPTELKHSTNTGDASKKGSSALQVSFCDLDWTVKTIGKQWLIIATTDELGCQGEGRKAESSTSARSANTTTLVQRPSTDMNAPAPGPFLTNKSIQRPPLGAVGTHGHLGDLSYLQWMREFDWGSSPVGPIESWPAELRQTCEHILASPDPVNILWGADCIFLYNKPFSVMVGDKHPCAMGRPFKESFPQWPEYYKIFDHMRETGESVQQEKVRRVLERDGQLEESFFEFVLTPILATDGFVAGFSTRVRVVTRQVIFQRRMQLLTETNKAIATTYDVHDLCTAAVDVAAMYRGDIHFAAVYSTDFKDHTVDLTLEGTAGLSAGYEGPSPPGGFEPLQLDLNDTLLEACRTRKSIILSTSDGTLKRETMDQLSRYGVSPCREVVIQPLLCFVEDSIAAVMVVGTSPLRPFDEDYRSFLQLMKSQIENGITVVRGIAREKELHKAQLNSELERRFWRFAEKAPVGMYMYSADDVLTFWNAAFEGICGVSGHDLKKPLAWMETVHPDGLADTTAVWESYTKSRCDETITFEVQFKKPWTQKHGDGEVSLDRTYALGILQPEYNEDGTLKGTLGCITDISLSKWAEKMQSARLAEAIEQKRQQENFLDVTSHEMSTFVKHIRGSPY